MEPELLDCSWCGSAQSVSNGLCQVCLMDHSHHAQVIPLPAGSAKARTALRRLPRDAPEAGVAD